MAPYLPEPGRAVICVPAARGESRPAQQCHANPEPSPLPGSEPGPAARAIHVSQGFRDNSLRRTCSTSRNPPVNSSRSPAEEVNYPGLSGRRLAPEDPKQSLKHLRLGAVRPVPKSLGGSPALPALSRCLRWSCQGLPIDELCCSSEHSQSLGGGGWSVRGSSFCVPCARGELCVQTHPAPGPSPSNPIPRLWLCPETPIQQGSPSFQGQV